MTIEPLTRRRALSFTLYLVPALIFLTAALPGRAQVITTVAGSNFNSFGGDGGPATSAWLQGPSSVAVDSAGNLFIADTKNVRIRKVNPAGTISTIAGNGSLGFSGDGGPGTSATLYPGWLTQGMAVDRAGNLYIADYSNFRVRKIDPAGVITTVAGIAGILDTPGPRFSGDGGAAISARLNTTTDVAVDSAGNLYIADSGNFRVRKVDTSGIITTVAGNGSFTHSGDGGPATSAGFFGPLSVAVDGNGNLYIGDWNASRIRKVDTAGIITTVAGNGTIGTAGDGGPATSAQFTGVTGIAVDSAGTIFAAESGTYRVRKINTAGIISTVAGKAGGCCFSGDGGLAANAELFGPTDVTLDSAGNLYIADSGNNRVRKVTGAGAVTPPQAAPVVTSVANAFGGSPIIAYNSWVEVKGSNLASATRIWRASDFVNNQLPTQLDGVGVTVNGKPAYIYYISPTQVNILTPPDLSSPASVPVELTNGITKSNLVNVQAQQFSPAFFVFDGSHVAATHADGRLIGPTTLYPGASTPAKPNETVILYANGFGPVIPLVTAGSVTQGGSLIVPPAIRIGGIAATVQFAGLVSPGLYQFNVVVPGAAPDGENMLTATYSSLNTQAGVVLTVQR